jgi:hypothetical protein
MPIHHIDVNDGAAAALGSRNFIGQMREIGGENGWEQFNHGVFRIPFPEAQVYQPADWHGLAG